MPFKIYFENINFIERRHAPVYFIEGKQQPVYWRALIATSSDI
jgi:hypothetical protein